MSDSVENGGRISPGKRKSSPSPTPDTKSKRKIGKDHDDDTVPVPLPATAVASTSTLQDNIDDPAPLPVPAPADDCTSTLAYNIDVYDPVPARPFIFPIIQSLEPRGSNEPPREVQLQEHDDDALVDAADDPVSVPTQADDYTSIVEWNGLIKVETISPPKPLISPLPDISVYSQEVKLQEDDDDALVDAAGDSGECYTRLYKGLVKKLDNTNFELSVLRKLGIALTKFNEKEKIKDMVYNTMKGSKVCYISNVYEDRDGSEEDVTFVRKTFKDKLGFGLGFIQYPKRKGPIKASHFLDKLMRIAKSDELKKCTCFVFIWMSHGGKDGRLKCSDGAYISVDDIVDKFCKKDCEALVGKPKVFIFQTCRGTEMNEGVQHLTTDAVLPTLQVHPLYADTLICYSTWQGYVSYRLGAASSSPGTPFIQHLCKIFDEYSHCEDVTSMMTRVNRRVAEETYRIRGQIGVQQPCQLNSLRKRLFLKW